MTAGSTTAQRPGIGEATAYALDNSLILPFGRSFEGGEVLNRGQFVAILSRLEGIDRDAVEQTGQFSE